jgi:hypothetical protein
MARHKIARELMIRVAYIAMTFLYASSAVAGPAECQAAAGEHEAIKLEMSSRVQDYLKCLELGGRNNACSNEFMVLEDAQYNLEIAVEKHKSTCS